jgi:transcriptional regulator with GAF, ATPase, and Fis domain
MVGVAEQVIWESQLMRDVINEAERAARSDAKILITGESGVGKEVIARLIHARSHRASRALVTVNCAGVPDTLLESELFGHVRGSFTDAVRDKAGLLEVADGGTVLLDEVGEMSLKMQALLLRFLENGEIQRVGAPQLRLTADVRVIAATNRDLRRQVKDRAFREDLFYRLNVLCLEIPPLRDRRPDILPLVRHYLRSFAAQYRVPAPELSADVLRRLEAYRWPGNVRELRNLIESLVARFSGQTVDFPQLPWHVQQSSPAEEIERPDVKPAGETLWNQIRDGASFWSAVYGPFMSRDITRDDVRFIVRKGLEHTRGNYTLLAQVLNLQSSDYKRFLNFLRKHDCHEPVRAFRTIPMVRPAA